MTPILAAFLFFAFVILGIRQFAIQKTKAEIQPFEPNTLDFPKAWHTLLMKNVRFYKKLDEEKRAIFQHHVLCFFKNCTISGVDVSLSQTDRLLVAASAVIPILGFKNWQRYPHLNEVLIYKNSFNHDFETEGQDRRVIGMVGWGFMNGMMVLSLPALRQGFKQAGRSNVGIHEFIHLLDKKDGSVDGVPEYLLNRQYVIPWMQLIEEEIKSIHDGTSDINPYGATKPSEFFAVAGEYFFQRPKVMEEKFPELFASLEHIFQQDLDGDGDLGLE